MRHDSVAMGAAVSRAPQSWLNVKSVHSQATCLSASSDDLSLHCRAFYCLIMGRPVRFAVLFPVLQGSAVI
jgi:hypothetical protein